MQGDALDADALILQFFQKLGSEVQPGRRRRHRAVLAGEHRLVVLKVLRILLALAADVRGQGHGADDMQALDHDLRCAIEGQRIDAVFALACHLGLQNAIVTNAACE